MIRYSFILVLVMGCGQADVIVNSQEQPLKITNLDNMLQANEVAAYVRTHDVTVIEIDSDGGLLAASEVIRKAITEDKVVICTVTGKAYSAAFMIFSYCTERYLTPRSSLMFHSPRYIIEGKTYTRGRLVEGFKPDFWDESERVAGIGHLDGLERKHMKHLRSVLGEPQAAYPACKTDTIKCSYDNDWYWDAARFTTVFPEVATLR